MLWDPKSRLGLTFKNRPNFRCVGHKVKDHKRCLWDIKAFELEKNQRFLRDIGQTSLTDITLTTLGQLAALCLCDHHEHQSNHVLQEWTRVLGLPTTQETGHQSREDVVQTTSDLRTNDVFNTTRCELQVTAPEFNNDKMVIQQTCTELQTRDGLGIDHDRRCCALENRIVALEHKSFSCWRHRFGARLSEWWRGLTRPSAVLVASDDALLVSRRCLRCRV
jgi:hypothetical protein